MAKRGATAIHQQLLALLAHHFRYPVVEAL